MVEVEGTEGLSVKTRKWDDTSPYHTGPVVFEELEGFLLSLRFSFPPLLPRRLSRSNLPDLRSLLQFKNDSHYDEVTSINSNPTPPSKVVYR